MFKYENWIGLHLSPTVNPVHIYENDKYIKGYYVDKYDNLIDECIRYQERSPPDEYSRDKGILKNKEEIIRITKVEIRELR